MDNHTLRNCGHASYGSTRLSFKEVDRMTIKHQDNTMEVAVTEIDALMNQNKHNGFLMHNLGNRSSVGGNLNKDKLWEKVVRLLEDKCISKHEEIGSNFERATVYKIPVIGYMQFVESQAEQTLNDVMMGAYGENQSMHALFREANLNHFNGHNPINNVSKSVRRQIKQNPAQYLNWEGRFYNTDMIYMYRPELKHNSLEAVAPRLAPFPQLDALSVNISKKEATFNQDLFEVNSGCQHPRETIVEFVNAVTYTTALKVRGGYGVSGVRIEHAPSKGGNPQTDNPQAAATAHYRGGYGGWQPFGVEVKLKSKKQKKALSDPAHEDIFTVVPHYGAGYNVPVIQDYSRDYLEINLGYPRLITHLGIAGEFPALCLFPTRKTVGRNKIRQFYQTFNEQKNGVMLKPGNEENGDPFEGFSNRNKFANYVNILRTASHGMSNVINYSAGGANDFPEDLSDMKYVKRFELSYRHLGTKKWVVVTAQDTGCIDCFNESVLSLRPFFNQKQGLYAQHLRVRVLEYHGKYPVMRCAVYGLDTTHPTTVHPLPSPAVYTTLPSAKKTCKKVDKRESEEGENEEEGNGETDNEKEESEERREVKETKRNAVVDESAIETVDYKLVQSKSIKESSTCHDGRGWYNSYWDEWYNGQFYSNKYFKNQDWRNTIKEELHKRKSGVKAFRCNPQAHSQYNGMMMYESNDIFSETVFEDEKQFQPSFLTYFGKPYSYHNGTVYDDRQWEEHSALLETGGGGGREVEVETCSLASLSHEERFVRAQQEETDFYLAMKMSKEVNGELTDRDENGNHNSSSSSSLSDTISVDDESSSHSCMNEEEFPNCFEYEGMDIHRAELKLFDYRQSQMKQSLLDLAERCKGNNREPKHKNMLRKKFRTRVVSNSVPPVWGEEQKRECEKDKVDDTVMCSRERDTKEDTECETATATVHSSSVSKDNIHSPPSSHSPTHSPSYAHCAAVILSAQAQKTAFTSAVCEVVVKEVMSTVLDDTLDAFFAALEKESVDEDNMAADNKEEEEQKKEEEEEAEKEEFVSTVHPSPTPLSPPVSHSLAVPFSTTALSVIAEDVNEREGETVEQIDELLFPHSTTTPLLLRNGSEDFTSAALRMSVSSDGSYELIEKHELVPEEDMKREEKGESSGDEEKENSTLSSTTVASVPPVKRGWLW